MPKISQEYRDARRQQILGAATHCFLQNGFQATSMQDLFAASKLSAGAFYVYFQSKDDVIVAIAEENMRMVTGLIAQLAPGGDEGPGSVGEALAVTLEAIAHRNEDDHLAAMAVLVWSEAVRSPSLRRRFTESVTRLREDLSEVIAAQQSAGALPAGVAAASLAGVLISIVPGAILQLAMLGEHAMDGAPAAARALWPPA